MANNPQSYILSFDFEKLTRQIDLAKESYEKLGSIIEKVIIGVREDTKEIADHSTIFANNIGLITAQLTSSFSSISFNVDNVLEKFKEFEKISSKVAENLKSFPQDVNLPDRKDGSTKTAGVPTVAGGKGGLKSLGISESEFSDLLASSRKAVGEAKKSLSWTQKAVSSLDKFVSSAASRETAALGRLAGKAPAALGAGGLAAGGVVAGLVSLVIWGEMETQRKKAQRGELQNIVEPALDAFSSYSQQALDKYAAFQEHISRYNGVSIEESGRVVKQFVTMGYEVKQFMNGIIKDSGEVTNSIAVMSLALDKHFELSAGTSARYATEMARDFNYSLEEAQDKFSRIGFAAQRSGVGIENFITNVMGASQALKQYGIDVEDVAEVYSRLQKEYVSGGLNEQKAGLQAASDLESIYGAVGRFDSATKALIAEQFGLTGGAQSAIIWFDDQLNRFKSGENKDFVFKVVEKLRNVISERGGGNREAFITMARETFGIDTNAALRLYEDPGIFTKPGGLEGPNSEQREALKKALETEGQTLTDLQKIQKNVLETLANIGSGILRVLSGILGMYVTIYRGIGLLAKSFFAKDPESRRKLWNEFTETMGKQIANIRGGFSDMFDAVKNGVNNPDNSGLASLLGPSAKTLMDAFNYGSDVTDTGMDFSMDSILDAVVDRAVPRVIELAKNEILSKLPFYDKVEGASTTGAGEAFRGIAESVTNKMPVPALNSYGSIRVSTVIPGSSLEASVERARLNRPEQNGQ